MNEEILDTEEKLTIIDRWCWKCTILQDPDTSYWYGEMVFTEKTINPGYTNLFKQSDWAVNAAFGFVKHRIINACNDIVKP